jgi:glycosyltransferase involved in cell wall biosynthesis
MSGRTQVPERPSRELSGVLDGIRILRFAHAYDAAGGIEQYLADLTHSLALRNSFTTVSLRCSRCGSVEKTSQSIGESRLETYWVPVSPLLEESRQFTSARLELCHRIKEYVFQKLAYVPQSVIRPILQSRCQQARPGEMLGLEVILPEVFTIHKPELVILHTSGGQDASVLIKAASQRGIPILLVHHYSNDRLAHLANRRQMYAFQLVGGVTSQDIPNFLRKRFYYVGDGIDTAFWRPSLRPRESREIVLFLPARLTASKGQLELLSILRSLRDDGIPVRLLLAGRWENDGFRRNLEQEIETLRLRNFVKYMGPLDAEKLRAAYNCADILAFPTRHHEGLPRVLLESQAMGVPPVVYQIGGTGEGLIHRKTGLLVPLGDRAAFERSLRELCVRPDFRTQLARNCRDFVLENFSFSKLAERHESFYLQSLRS